MGSCSPRVVVHTGPPLELHKFEFYIDYFSTKYRDIPELGSERRRRAAWGAWRAACAQGLDVGA